MPKGVFCDCQENLLSLFVSLLFDTRSVRFCTYLFPVQGKTKVFCAN